MRTWMSDQDRGTFFAATGGLIAITLGSVLVAAGRSGGVALALVGIFFWAIAGTANRWQHLALRLFGAQLEAKLAEKEHGERFAEAAEDAPDSVLEAVIPLLREDAASHVLELGEAFDGKRLLDPALSWLRKDVNVTVFAVSRPGDGEKWTGGGRVSTLPLPRGTRLAVIGEAPDIAAAEARLSQSRPG